ncbi:phenazine biosynthesis PhzC/PhzF protein [Tilletiaria anomala UBC 951]|uniref:Phenazine biosynthesis PhzC/PhzF protein n=1 Tax=Tilletiaria anomala (strain ATCC 24038 / CBS 436.72 / UBC 951) TaxID=1037660 RepID=A0A066VZ94_TILAU|nr:phenazine biosynthesis PhzC/PhzF protein [Tilletiaria anomala UBC 951]KDN46796.1 phenazine biosynthesis PhzC/PhzF protein [Tilletiaria anomala UBC 951]
MKEWSTPLTTQPASVPRERPFAQVDVFTAIPYFGNPVAVVKDGTGLTTSQMQAFANWTNLSETTFLLPPTDANKGKADYRVRIFTPTAELPFAGHPSLGSCHAWLESRGENSPSTIDSTGKTIVQECDIGLITIRIDSPSTSSAPSGRLAIQAPQPKRSGPVEEDIIVRTCKAMGIGREDVAAHQWLENGPKWFGLLLKGGARAVLDVKINDAALAPAREFDWGIVGMYDDADPQTGGTDEKPLFEVRAFAPDSGVLEDPVTGSLNLGIAQWLIKTNVAPPTYISSQGTCLGRRGRVHISSGPAQQEGGLPDVWAAGDTITCIKGTVLI